MKKRILLIVITIMYILHELGHILMLVLLNLPFEGVLFPTIRGVVHLLVIYYSYTGNFFIELIIIFIAPISLQLLFALIMKQPKWLLIGIIFSFNDLQQFLFY